MVIGSVVISLDAELGWGFHDLPSVPRQRVERARWGWRRSQSLLERYGIPATWAIVGHLFLESCDGEHADHPTPPGWFDRERTDWRDRPDLRFAPALIRSLIDDPVDHEIASHSFSHVLFGEESTTAAMADAECRRAREIAADWGLDLTSFVFPRNEVGHRGALADHGFSIYRSRSPFRAGAPSVLSELTRDRSLLVEPTVDDRGLIDLPASMFAFGFEGTLRRLAETVGDDPMVILARRGIDQAVADDGIFHLWWHPNNLTTDTDCERIRRILEYVDRRRDADGLTVETMAQVASSMRVLERA